MGRLSVLLVALFVAGSGGSTELVFHHVHYRVGDPAAAMDDAIRRFGGSREIVQGLGVGVRIDRQFVLFDRDEGAAGSMAQPSFAEAYRLAQSRLAQRMLAASPEDAPRVAVPGLAFDHIAFKASAADFEPVADRISKSPRVTVVSRRGDSALFDVEGLRLEIVRDPSRPDAFWCPMHPDVRSPDAVKCSLCGMALVPIPPPKVGEYKLDVAVHRTPAGARGFGLTIRAPDTLAVVRDLVVVHEKRLHLFIVRRDLEYFAHVHPEQTTDASFVIRHELPPGEYMLLADFLPEGGTSQMVQRAVLVGDAGALAVESPAGDFVPGADTITVDGVRVTLKAEDFEPGKHACLTFTLGDSTTGKPITDLQPYLGAPAHMILVRADLADAVHAHPEERQTGGPSISFHPMVPAPGHYKLWVQFQRAGRVITVPFVLSAGA